VSACAHSLEESLSGKRSFQLLGAPQRRRRNAGTATPAPGAPSNAPSLRINGISMIAQKHAAESTVAQTYLWTDVTLLKAMRLFIQSLEGH